VAETASIMAQLLSLLNGSRGQRSSPVRRVRRRPRKVYGVTTNDDQQFLQICRNIGCVRLGAGRMKCSSGYVRNVRTF
jgi:hypothetical protein